MNSSKLKELREKFNVTQKEVADAIGTSVPRISEWENDKHKISNSYQKLLIDFFKKYTK